MTGALRGRRVLVTRRWPELVAALRSRGAGVAEVPAIAVGPPEDPAPLEAALRGLDAYAWLVFTSASAVEAVKARREAMGEGALPARLRLATVGPATTRAVHEAWPGVAVEVQPPADFKGESLVAAFAGRDLAGRRVLLPVSDRAADVVERGLAGLGARVDRVTAYTTQAGADPGLLAAALQAGLHAATFASPSAVQGFLEAAGEEGRAVPAVAIGPTTAEAARRAGLAVAAVAESATAEGVAEAVERALAVPPGRP